MYRLTRASCNFGLLWPLPRTVVTSNVFRTFGLPVYLRQFSLSSRYAHTRKFAQPYVKTADPVTGTVRRRTPGAPPPIQQEIDDAAACRIAIDQGELPETIFRSRLQSGNLSRPVAAVCLMAADDRGYVEAKLGQAALDWIWDSRGDVVYPDDNDLVHAMVRLLVREGEEDQIWRWLRCESTRPKTLPGYVQYEWRGTALKGLVMHKAQLSTDGSLDEAISTYLDAAKSFYVPAGGASTWLKSQIEVTGNLADHERSPTING